MYMKHPTSLTQTSWAGQKTMAKRKYATRQYEKIANEKQDMHRAVGLLLRKKRNSHDTLRNYPYKWHLCEPHILRHFDTVQVCIVALKRKLKIVV